MKMMDRLPPKYRKRGRTIFMTDKDAAAFGDLLKNSFPDIEFATIDKEKRSVTRFPSLIEAIEHCREAKLFTRVHGWIAPSRWKPRWRLSYKDKAYTRYDIANLPAGWFIFDGSWGFKPFNPNAPDPVLTLHPGSAMLMTRYDVNDVNVRRFIDKVYRLLAKVTVNRFASVIPDTQEVVKRFKFDMFWAGYDALEVCRQRQDHYIWCGGLDSQKRRTFLKPYDWSPDQAGAAKAE